MALHMRGYNYDIPENAESYIHRIGRTGRAGEKSYTCLFIAPNDKEALRKIYKISNTKKGIKINWKLPIILES